MSSTLSFLVMLLYVINSAFGSLEQRLLSDDASICQTLYINTFPGPIFLERQLNALENNNYLALRFLLLSGQTPSAYAQERLNKVSEELPGQELGEAELILNVTLVWIERFHQRFGDSFSAICEGGCNDVSSVLQSAKSIIWDDSLDTFQLAPSSCVFGATLMKFDFLWRLSNQCRQPGKLGIYISKLIEPLFNFFFPTLYETLSQFKNTGQPISLSLQRLRTFIVQKKFESIAILLPAEGDINEIKLKWKDTFPVDDRVCLDHRYPIGTPLLRNLMANFNGQGGFHSHFNNIMTLHQQHSGLAMKIRHDPLDKQQELAVLQLDSTTVFYTIAKYLYNIINSNKYFPDPKVYKHQRPVAENVFTEAIHQYSPRLCVEASLYSFIIFLEKASQQEATNSPDIKEYFRENLQKMHASDELPQLDLENGEVPYYENEATNGAALMYESGMADISNLLGYQMVFNSPQNQNNYWPGFPYWRSIANHLSTTTIDYFA